MERNEIAIVLLLAMLACAWAVWLWGGSFGAGTSNDNLEGLLDRTSLFRGYRAYMDNSLGLCFTTGSSMEPALRTGDTAIWVKVPFENLQVGDVIVYSHTVTVGENRGQIFIVVHRIINTVEDGVFTKGDNLSSPDAYKVRPGDFIGLVRGVLFTSSGSWER
ncbi:MAG: signal peptidase I [Candidatus Hadarchaeales archaeon]